jgi:ubiquinone/menaquinone biosynthesis C-methylase UbiE
MHVLLITVFLFLFQEDFKSMIEAAGFCQVNYENLTCGVVAIHSGFKF